MDRVTLFSASVFLLINSELSLSLTRSKSLKMFPRCKFYNLANYILLTIKKDRATHLDLHSTEGNLARNQHADSWVVQRTNPLDSFWTSCQLLVPCTTNVVDLFLGTVKSNQRKRWRTKNQTFLSHQRERGKMIYFAQL